MKTKQLIVMGVALILGTGILFLAEASDNKRSTRQKQPSDSIETVSQKKTEKKPDRDIQLRQFMRLKLQASNLILEGLVTEDFKKINQGATQLGKMSAAEKWRASNDPLYLQHSSDFRRLVDKLKKKAANDNLDACALIWLDVTMSCLECHEFVRSVLIAEDGRDKQKQLSLLSPVQTSQRQTR